MSKDVSGDDVRNHHGKSNHLLVRHGASWDIKRIIKSEAHICGLVSLVVGRIPDRKRLAQVPSSAEVSNRCFITGVM